MSLRLNGGSSHLTVSCPPLFIVKSRFHLILKLLDLVSLVTFDVFQNFLPVSFVFIPTHYIKMRFFSLKPLEHSFVLPDNHLVVSQPFLKIKRPFRFMFIFIRILRFEKSGAWRHRCEPRKVPLF